MLGVASLAVQPYANVVSKHGIESPLSLHLLTIGESGERKSRVYKLALTPAIQYAMKHDTEHKENMKKYERQMAIYNNEFKKIIAANTQALEKDTKIQLLSMPERPIDPTFICGDPTVDGVITLFLKGRPSLGLFNPEAAQFVGGYSLNEENRDRTSGTLNKFWDGEPVDRVRVKEGEIYTLFNRRLAACLMLQPQIASKLYGMKSILDIGWFSRLLVSYPESTIGRAMDVDEETNLEIPFQSNTPPTSDSVLEWYNWTLFKIFDCPMPMKLKKLQELEPLKLHFSEEAKEDWSMFHDVVEIEMNEGGKYHSIKGFGRKMPEHAARIAGVMTLIENFNAYKMNPESVLVESKTFMDSTVIATYFAEHLKAMITEGEDNVDLDNAIKLEAWLNKNIEGQYVSARMIERLGPGCFRGKGNPNEIQREAAIAILQNNGYLTRIPSGTIINGIKTRSDSLIWEYHRR